MKRLHLLIVSPASHIHGRPRWLNHALGVYEGSVFITRRAETEIQSTLRCIPLIHSLNHVIGRLEGSEFAADLKDIIDVFDKETKLEFEDPEEDYKIRFGGRNDNDEERGIRKGELTLKGYVDFMLCIGLDSG